MLFPHVYVHQQIAHSELSFATNPRFHDNPPFVNSGGPIWVHPAPSTPTPSSKPHPNSSFN
eukprot:scaffold82087_cov33-Tisochrysis_lutea.AAC.1